MLTDDLRPNQKLLMLKRFFIISFFILAVNISYSQVTPVDTIPRRDIDSAMLDADIDYDELLDGLDLFLDSILTPRNNVLINLSAGQGYFNYIVRNTRRITTVKKYIWSPSIGYFDKGGFGISGSGSIINDSAKRNMYQVAISPSFDHISDRRLAIGISFTRYFTKKKLSFYTSPLQKEINAYFLWRKSWLQPGISLNYGWGSRSEYTAQLIFIDSLKKRAILFNHTEESVADFSTAFTLRHDFYWLDIFSKKDYIKFSPLLSFSMGTQKFGFNRTTGITSVATTNVLYNAGNVSLDNTLKFQPLSLTLYIRPEYLIGKFFIQPQLLLDYYFPGEKNNFSALFSFNTGFVF